MSKKILIVEDEKEIAELIAYTLQKEKFEVDIAFDGNEALKKLREKVYDLIVLDLMLPYVQGFEICKFVRSNPEIKDTGIIIVTAKGEEFDRVMGLEMGADDYITKPFSPRELTARIKAILRRVKTESMGQVIKIGEITIDKEKYIVTVRDKQIRLSAKEFKLLLYLAERPNKIFSRDHLLDAIWGQDVYLDSRTVDVHIRRLRMKIEKDPDNPEYIKTMRGVGYYIEA
ncbi:MAG: response regulator transcription factor [Thermodesulfovibrio sp.]|nr:response regulator transcription factor [Thermodesulfovibrio sp.]